MPRALLALALAALVPLGCAYRLVSHGPPVDVSVDTFRNDTLEPGLELMVAAALRRELGRADRLRLVERESADGFAVRGRVATVETLGRTFTPAVRALEFTVVVSLALDIRGPDGRTLIVDPFALRASEIYLASTDVEISRKNRAEALRRVTALLATRIHDELERALADGGAP